MIKVLIVDDDFPVRMLFKQIINWNEEGFQIVGEAIDGEEAVNKVAELNPDLIILDIEMPKMNGVEVIKEINSQGYKGKIIVISCHDDFKYVKEALKLGATDYLLKNNVNKAKLKEVIHVIKRDLLQEKQSKIEYSTIKRWANKGLHIMKQEYLKNILEGVNILEEDISENISKLKLNISESNNMIIAIEIDRYTKQVTKVGSQKDYELFNFTIRNIIEEILSESMEGELINLKHRFYVILNIEEWVSESKLRETVYGLVKRVKDSLLKYLDINVTIMIFDQSCSLKDAQKVYKQLKKALKIKFYEGSNRIYYFSQTKPIKNYQLNFDKQKDIQMQEYIKSNQKNELEQLLKEDFEYIRKNYIDPDKVYEYFSEIYLSLEKVCKKNKIALEQFVQIQDNYYDTIRSMETFDEIEKTVLTINNKIFDSLKNSIESTNETVKEIVKYMTRHYMDDISLMSASEYVDMNMTYVSHLFKQEMGESFTEYLKGIRIHRAKYLIDTTDKRINEIADLVGIPNKKYFAKLFKEKVGESPSKYKKQKNLS